MIARWLRKKRVIYTLLALPALILAGRLVLGDLGVDPLEALFEALGKTTVYLLIATLCLTPLRVLFPKSQIVRSLNRHRRAIGVSVFWYGCAHLTGATLYEGGPGEIAAVLNKPFYLAGFTAWCLLAILSVTSLTWFVRKLGPRAWKNLHRLAYLIAILAFYHYGVSGKGHWDDAIRTFSPLAVLQIARVLKQQVFQRKSRGGT